MQRRFGPYELNADTWGICDLRSLVSYFTDNGLEDRDDWPVVEQPSQRKCRLALAAIFRHVPTSNGRFNTTPLVEVAENAADSSDRDQLRHFYSIYQASVNACLFEEDLHGWKGDPYSGGPYWIHSMWEIPVQPGVPHYPLMADLVRDVVPNPFRPVAFDPAWRSSTAVSLAQTMYSSRDFAAMPVLADALEEAGCDHPGVLAHFRNPAGVHVRGCWVVDLVLGKA